MIAPTSDETGFILALVCSDSGCDHQDRFEQIACGVNARSASTDWSDALDWIEAESANNAGSTSVVDKVYAIEAIYEAVSHDAARYGHPPTARLSHIAFHRWQHLRRIAADDTTPSRPLLVHGSPTSLADLAESARSVVTERLRAGQFAEEPSGLPLEDVIRHIARDPSTPAREALEMLLPRYMVTDLATDTRSRPAAFALGLMAILTVAALVVARWAASAAWIPALGAFVVAAAAIFWASGPSAERSFSRATLMLRIPSFVAVGLGVLLTLDPFWLIQLSPGDAWLPCALLLGVAFMYLYIEVTNHEVTRGADLLRSMLLFSISLVWSIASSVLALSWLWGFFHPGEDDKAWGSGSATGLAAIDHPFTAVAVCAAAALASGLLIQAVWDDRPVSAPLATSRRIIPTKEK